MGQRIADGTVPEFTFIWLPVDHTGPLNLSPCGPGTKCASVTSTFQVQDGDAATGQVVDFLSHSPVWRSSAIFIAADDAQSTADHVYAHRTYATVVSPWAKREAVVHTLGSTVSITKTAEELLGVPPVNYGDAMATDLADYFTTTPDYSPYDVVGAPVLRYAGAGEARLARGLRGTPGRVRATGREMKVRRSPRIAGRISRLLDRLDGGLDQDTARIGAINGLWMQSVRLARSHHANGRAYHRAQDRLYARAKLSSSELTEATWVRRAPARRTHAILSQSSGESGQACFDDSSAIRSTERHRDGKRPCINLISGTSATT